MTERDRLKEIRRAFADFATHIGCGFGGHIIRAGFKDRQMVEERTERINAANDKRLDEEFKKAVATAWCLWSAGFGDQRNREISTQQNLPTEPEGK